MSDITLSLTIIELLSIFLSTIFLVVYYQYRQCYKYWKQLGVEQLNPTFPTGDLSTAFDLTSIYVRFNKLHKKFREKNLKYGGIYFFNGPIFLPLSPDLIKRILVTDFDYFMDRGLYINAKQLPISAHIFTMEGQQWRDIRRKCSPAFTSGKMKSIFEIFKKNAQILINVLNEYNSGEEINIKRKLTCFTSDNIGTAAFGVDCNSLEYPDGEYGRMVDTIFQSSKWDLFKLILTEGIQNPGNILKLLHNNENVVKYFTNLVHNTIENRDRNQIIREDLMNVFMKLRETNGMTIDEIVAQCFLFLIAGFETTSTAMNYAIHELAFNQKIQDCLREEIVQNLGKDITQFTYDTVLKLPLLDRVVKETLRKHPPSPIMHRIVVKPYQIPDTDIVLPIGMPVVISMLALHRDPEYWPNPSKFDPERFNSENIGKIIPYSYIPFGYGPRNCIGMKFGLMQTKLVIASLVSNFKFVPIKNAEQVRKKMVVKIFKV